ncbi:MAG: hypothetical protein DRN08_05250 [Thermoplasmata archaeon]|nr:MAG: hypothetical protein DRN08_05250 [Thermoplasmata archaeon]
MKRSISDWGDGGCGFCCDSSKLRFLVVNVNGVKLPRYCYDADKKGIVEGLKRFFGIGCKNDSPEDLVDHRGGIYIYEVCGVTAGFVGNCMVFVG